MSYSLKKAKSNLALIKLFFSQMWKGLEKRRKATYTDNIDDHQILRYHAFYLVGRVISGVSYTHCEGKEIKGSPVSTLQHLCSVCSTYKQDWSMLYMLPALQTQDEGLELCGLTTGQALCFPTPLFCPFCTTHIPFDF